MLGVGKEAGKAHLDTVNPTPVILFVITAAGMPNFAYSGKTQ